MLKIEYQATTLAEYALRFAPKDRTKIEAVKNPRRIETHFVSPQLHLWQRGETEWLLAFRQPERKPRTSKHPSSTEIVQLPLPDMDVRRTGTAR